YPDIFSSDKAIIKLPQTTENPFGYINASKITFENCGVTFYASQGPLMETVEHHWQMIWQEKISLIIMLTHYEEDGKQKCYDYLPSGKSGLKFGDLTISTLEAKLEKMFMYKTIQIKKDKKIRKVKFLQFLAWPDKDVPEFKSFRKLLSKMREQQNPTFTDNILVHCSAGVGRTGVLILIWYNYWILMPLGI
ncbi:MAG: hypothetical protein MHPSP_003106, partial [Paramarteilia canceri]